MRRRRRGKPSLCRRRWLVRFGEALEHVSSISLVQNNFYQSPDYLALQAMLIEALAPFPDAMRAVLAGLEALEGDTPVDAPKLIEGRTID
jgi:hypothetical protein